MSPMSWYCGNQLKKTLWRSRRRVLDGGRSREVGGEGGGWRGWRVKSGRKCGDEKGGVVGGEGELDKEWGEKHTWTMHLDRTIYIRVPASSERRPLTAPLCSTVAVLQSVL